MNQTFVLRSIGRWVVCPLVLAWLWAGFAKGDENGFDYYSSESRVELVLTAGSGAAPLQMSEQTTLQAVAVLKTWDVWVNASTSAAEMRNEAGTPLEGLTLNFSMMSGDGTVDASATTDAQGAATVSFTMGSQTSTVRVWTYLQDGAYAEADRTLYLLVPGDTESWQEGTDEGSIMVTITPNGSTTGLSSGEWRSLQAQVVQERWKVQTSSLGNFRYPTRSLSTANAATVTWSVVNGDGYTTASSGVTDALGCAWSDFYMGSAETTVRADVFYAASGSAMATLSFTPPDEVIWSYDRMGGAYQFADVSVDGSTESLLPGDQRNITGRLYWSTWEVWVDGNGNEEQRNHWAEPVTNTYFNLSSGNDGQVTPAACWTDGSGWFWGTFTMGAAASQVMAASPDNASAATLASFTPPPPPEEIWTLSSTEEAKQFVFGGHVSAFAGDVVDLTAEVRLLTREIWTSNLGGTYETEWSTAPAPGEAVSFQLVQGNGSLASASAVTNANGQATVSYSMGNEPAQVSASPGYDTTINGLMTIDLVEEQWWHDRNEGIVGVSLQTEGPTSGLPAGREVEVEAWASYTTWEVWMSNKGGEDYRNQVSGPAIGAPVSFSITSGDGTVTTQAGNADNSGVVTTVFTMHNLNSVLRVDVSASGTSAHATLNLGHGVWQQVGGGMEVLVNLSSEVSAGVPRLVADVSRREWTSWSTGTISEVRDESISQAEGAVVSFSVQSAGGGSLMLEAPSAVTDAFGRCSVRYAASSAQVDFSAGAQAAFDGATGTASVSGQASGSTDADQDGVTDALEIQLGANAFFNDSDGDGIEDAVELLEGTPSGATGSLAALTGVRVFVFTPDASAAR